MSLPVTPERPAARDDSMARQKEMISGLFDQLATAKADGRKVVSTFVPGNLTELIRSFDALPLLPEINALQSGMRKLSGEFVREAEKSGHSEDVCAYVKSDLGMLRKGNLGPTGKPLPDPDLLLLSYTGCFTFMKWFELLQQEYDAPVTMLHVPYQADGRVTDEMVTYVVRQLEEKIIPALEAATGRKYDETRLQEMLARSAQAEDDLVWVLQSAKRRPSPIDGYFAAVYYIGPIFSAFRGTEEGNDYYRLLRREIEERIAKGLGPMTPDGEIKQEKYRLVVEGPPAWTHFREFWKMFSEEGAVCVASTYTKVGGLYDTGFRHDPEKPLESLARYCLGCYTNLSLPARVDFIAKYVQDYQADGFLINSVKSCNSFSAGQLLILREVEKRTGVPGAFIESDLVDPRYFSAANIKNRLESYLQMIEQRRQGALASATGA